MTDPHNTNEYSNIPNHYTLAIPTATATWNFTAKSKSNVGLLSITCNTHAQPSKAFSITLNVLEMLYLSRCLKKVIDGKGDGTTKTESTTDKRFDISVKKKSKSSTSLVFDFHADGSTKLFINKGNPHEQDHQYIPLNRNTAILLRAKLIETLKHFHNGFSAQDVIDILMA